MAETHTEEKPHVCDSCFTVFSSEESLQEHRVSAHDASLYVCQLCKLIFTKEEDLNEHIAAAHAEYNVGVKNEVKEENGKVFQCATCDETFMQAIDLTLHMFNAKHVGKCEINDDDNKTSDDKESDGKRQAKVKKRKKRKQSACTVCGKTFTKKRYMDIHMLVHTGEKPYECDECGRAFRQRSALRTHMVTHTGARPFPCSVCGASFTTSFSMKRHYKIHTGEKPHKCTKCGKSFRTKVGLNEHMNTHDNIRYGCGVCGKSFTSKPGLKLHGTIHSGDRPFKCDECGKTFAKKTRYQRHLLVHEDRRTEDQKIRDLILDNCFTKKCYSFKSMENRCGRKSSKVNNRCYRCTKCDSKFSRKVDFGIHLRSCFQKPFKCKKCKRSFFSMKTVETHQRIHEHKRRHTCRNCVKSFSVSCLLIRHLSVVHSEKIVSIDPAVNQCPMCRNIYARRRSLRIHLVSHTKQQHQCKLCGKAFPTLGKFTRHYNSCLRSKIKHECNICGKVFKCKKYVTRHMNTHREVKPHQCDICHKMLTKKGI